MSKLLYVSRKKKYDHKKPVIALKGNGSVVLNQGALLQFQSWEKEVWVVSFFTVSNKSHLGKKHWWKIINSNLLRKQTAVPGGLYFLVEALCFSEQEVTVLNRRPRIGLSSLSGQPWQLAVSFW